MKVLGIALYAFLGVSTHAFVIGPNAQRFPAALTSAATTTSFMSLAAETADEETSVEADAEAPSVEAEAAVEAKPESKERHTIYVGNLPYGR